MREIPFSVAISGVVHIDGDSITITVNKTETAVRIEPWAGRRGRLSLGEGKTLFDVVLQAARDVVSKKGANRFRAAEVYHEALTSYPELKRNSFGGHVIASAPNHPSYQHFSTRKDYFSYSGDGWYRLTDRYVEDKTGTC